MTEQTRQWAPGWYDDSAGSTRWWDGQGWTERTKTTEVSPVPVDVRKMALARAVQQEVAAGGRVESQSDFSAIIRWDKPVNHVLHLILTLVTLTVWSWVWLIVWIVAVTQRRTITLNVDEFGQVLRQQVR